MLTVAKRQSHGDEEPALKGADLRHRPVNAHLTLAAQKMPADRRRETRRHSTHLIVPFREIAIDRRNPASERATHDSS